jgi:membrane fusion protein, multidrug efflux system
MSTIDAVDRTAVSDITETAPPRSRRKRILGAAIGAALVLGTIYGAHWWTTGRFIEDTEDAYVGGDVTVIGPKISGYVTQLAVSDNQQVHAGDLLVKIDDRDYRAALAKADGAVAAEEALLANLDATAQLQAAIIGQARAGIAVAEAESTRARDDEARYRDLAGRSAVSVESAQRADATYKTARANDDKALAVLTANERQLDVIASQKQQARAALLQANAERDIAKLNVGYTELRAPIDGTIGNRRARVGTFAPAGSQLLAGQSVIIRADVLPGRTFHGRLASLAPATGAEFSVLPPENATGNFTKIVQRVPVRVVLDKQDDVLGALRPGLSVVAEVDTRASGTAGAP